MRTPESWKTKDVLVIKHPLKHGPDKGTVGYSVYYIGKDPVGNPYYKKSYFTFHFPKELFKNYFL